jgi:hypothetical protein
MVQVYPHKFARFRHLILPRLRHWSDERRQLTHIHPVTHPAGRVRGFCCFS